MRYFYSRLLVVSFEAGLGLGMDMGMDMGKHVLAYILL